MFDKIVELIIILVTSLPAVFLSLTVIPDLALFIARHFGSGVILSTALIHLLEPANDALSNDKLDGFWQDYPVAYGLCLLMIFVVLLVETLIKRKTGYQPHVHSNLTIQKEVLEQDEQAKSGQLTSLLILESGILMHSLFIGISLALAKENGFPLFIAITLHQLFEGLGLGARLIAIKWELEDSWKPLALGWLFAIATPLGVIIGLFIQQSYDPESPGALILTGTFDALSSGVLLYTGLVELIAHEFLSSSDLISGRLSDVMIAYFSTLTGALVMASLAIWV